MPAVTPWGYVVTATAAGEAVDSLPPIIGIDEFASLVPDLSSGPERIGAVLAKASAVVRDWCGWHVGPALSCEWVGDGAGRQLCLPLMAVRSVGSVEVSGVALGPGDYEWRDTGLVRLARGTFPESWRSVSVSCVAGVESDALAQVVAQLATNALTAAPGVAEERTGDVSVSWNRSADGVTGGIRLLGSDREALAPYRIARAW